MNDLEPSWSLTDDALVLILHAENDINETMSTHRPLSGMRIGQLGGTMADESWLRETAILRLISTVEAYTNAASEMFFTMKSLPPAKTPFTWPQRIKHYKNQHSIDLEARDGWDQVKAGIDLRNCLAHGLGNLTELLLSEVALGVRMKHINVSVSGNRMHPTVTTVSKLAAGCRRFVLDIEQELITLL
ncbi:hypothetical protein [Nonomuraea sp. NPDC005501]|uniref:hypothetical protein n=1 Tax=Nonomuraea sp. NPDC005501 TaxID=3156884 RepID=UPI0033AE1D02